MTSYIKLSTLEYPRHEGDIRLEHPEIPAGLSGTSFPCPETYALVQWVEPPEIDETVSVASEGRPELVDGVWRTTWNVRQFTQEELDRAAERQRQAMLTSISAPGTAPDVIE